MISEVKIIRTVYGDHSHKVFREIPPFPTITNQVIYVWGEENERWLKKCGYETRLQREEDLPDFIDDQNHLFRKLVTLKKSLEEFEEVLFIDWDCRILKPFDDVFYQYLKEKPIQCPIYSQHKDVKNTLLETNPNPTPSILKFYENIEITFKEYSWKHGNQFIVPNFGVFYSRD